MKARITRKVLKRQDTLRYSQEQIAKAKKVVARHAKGGKK